MTSRGLMLEPCSQPVTLASQVTSLMIEPDYDLKKIKAKHLAVLHREEMDLEAISLTDADGSRSGNGRRRGTASGAARAEAF